MYAARMSKRESFVLGDREVSPGKRRTIQLLLTESLLDRPMSLTVRVIHGRRPGPTLFVSAAIHGDELVGVEVVRRLARRRYSGLRGTLILVPVVNLHGFLAHERYLPDRRDLNRCFPGRERGSLAARLAHLLTEEVVARSDVGIDLHTGSGHRANLPQLRADLEDPEVMRLARAFAAPVAIDARVREGSMRGAAAALGVPVLVFEAGEALRVDEASVRHGVRGVTSVMCALGMTRGCPPQRDVFLARRTTWSRAPRSGLFACTVAPGDQVEAGQVVGTVENLLGDEREEVRARGAGVVIGWRVMPPVREGDALVHIALLEGSEGEPPDAEDTELYD